MVIQLGTGGELFDRICDMGKLTEGDAIRTMKQALDVINYLHGREIVHRCMLRSKVPLFTQLTHCRSVPGKFCLRKQRGGF